MTPETPGPGPAPAQTRWTPQQERAIAASGSNLLVSAAAGTGKTKVLVERVIRHLGDPESPLDVDRLLVVTFTDAAATEVRARIGVALQQKVQAGGGGAHLERQFAQLNRAAISTLHSFCLGLLRRYFYRLDIDPAFRVMDEGEAALMQIDVVEEVLERRYAAAAGEGGAASAVGAVGAGGDGFTALVERYGGPRGDLALQDLVLRLYDFVRSQPWPMEWLARAAAVYDLSGVTGLSGLAWGWAALAGAGLELDRAAEKLSRAAALAAQPGGPRHYIAQLQAEGRAVAGAAATCQGGDWPTAATAASGLPAAFKRLPGVRDDAPGAKARREAVQDLRNAAKDIVKRVVASHFGRGEDELLAELGGVAPHARALVDLVAEFDRAYKAAKSARAVLDFSDLEHMCLELLTDKADAGDGVQAAAGGGAAGMPSSLADLRPSDVALELRERFAEVLVDEYQDISPVEDALLAQLSRQPSAAAARPWAPNLFMVGDVKQSIYRFRLAEPALFMRRMQSYPSFPAPGADGGTPGPAAGPAAGLAAGPAVPGWRVDLTSNFRSRRGIVDAVNFVFRQVMSGRVGEMPYDEAAELVYGASYPEGMPDAAIELHVVERAGEGAEGDAGGGGAGGAANGEAGADGDEGAPGGAGEAGGEAGDEGGDGARARADDGLDIEDLLALEREALLIAQRIREMVEGGAGGPTMVFDPAAGAMRPVRYRDIAVLMRATRGRANVIVEELSRHGVPASAELGTGYFAAIEVEVALAILRVIDNPRQDIPLAAVLRSPVVGLDAAQLARVRLCARHADFYDAVVAAAARQEEGEDGLPVGELKRFLAQLDGWRTAARRGPVSELVWRLYRDTGYLDYVGALPGGSQRQANLRALHDRARQFDQFARQGLFRFLRFIDRLRETAGDLGVARALGENEDVVRVMSIHKSKGLEFPVVFLADLGKMFSREESSASVLYHRDLGLALDCVDLDLRSSWPTVAGNAVAFRQRVEGKAEELRILYVGMTRARERLVLVGSAHRLPRLCARWAWWAGHQGWPLPDAELVGAETYLDWLVPAVARHADGQAVRAAARAEVAEDAAVRDHPSRWQVRLWDRRALEGLAALRRAVPRVVPGVAPAEAAPAEAARVETAREAAAVWVLPADAPWDRIAALEPLDDTIAPPRDAALASEVARRLDWRYPYAPAAGRAAKVSVSELKRLYDHSHEDAELRDWARQAAPLRRPRFLSQETARLTPTERGSAAHVVMQHLDLGAALDEADVRAQVAAMVARELLIPEHAAAVDAAAVARLLATPLGLLMRERRAALRRELPFSIALPAGEVHPRLDPDAAGEDRVLVQGMIDCLIPDGDGFILVDFKTDRLDDTAHELLAARYRLQLAVYARAVTMISGRPVTQAFLAFIGAGGGLALAVDISAVTVSGAAGAAAATGAAGATGAASAAGGAAAGGAAGTVSG